MPQRGNVLRLPTPPQVTGSFQNHQQEMQAISDYLKQTNTILNQGLQSLQNRLNTVQQTGAAVPPNVTGLTVTGQQGCFALTWNRIVNVDGYVIIQASDAAMTQRTGRFNISDGQQCSYNIPVGNVAITAYFEVYAYQGNHYGDPSPAVKATTKTYTTSESAPPAPPLPPPPPKIVPVRSGPNL